MAVSPVFAGEQEMPRPYAVDCFVQELTFLVRGKLETAPAGYRFGHKGEGSNLPWRETEKWKFQDTMKISELPKDLRRLVKDMKTRSRGRFKLVRTPGDDYLNGYSQSRGISRKGPVYMETKEREFGFIVIETRGRKAVGKVTSSRTDIVLRTHIDEALNRLLARVDKRDIKRIQIFHSHPDSEWGAGLSDGDMNELVLIKEHLFQNAGIDVPLEIYSSSIKSAEDDVIHRFRLEANSPPAETLPSPR